MNSLRRGGSSVYAMNTLTYYVWETTRARELHLWADRVASKDNPTDAASRGQTQDLYNQGWQWDAACWPDLPAYTWLAGPQTLKASLHSRTGPRKVKPEEMPQVDTAEATPHDSHAQT